MTTGEAIDWRLGLSNIDLYADGITRLYNYLLSLTLVQAALEKDRYTKRTMLFPVRLNDTVMETSQAWAAKVRRERHITDFRGRKNHDIYQKQFARLLRDLQAVDAQEVVAPTVAQSPKAKTMPTETYRTSLRKNLAQWFNDSELIAFCERWQSVPDLVARCKELRPKVEWEGEYE